MQFVAFFAIILVAAVVGDQQVELISRSVTYAEAVEFCESKGSGYFLYVPRDEKQNRDLYRDMTDAGIQRAWIGLSTRDPVSRVFVDRNNRKPHPVFWGPYEPNDHGGNENCGEMRVLDKNNPVSNWNDRPCEHLNPFYCAREIPDKSLEE